MRPGILVVDDSPDHRTYIGEILRRHFPDRPVLHAEDGETALASAHANRPDLILLDVRMPGMDGFEASRRLKGHRATTNIPILMFSGTLHEEASRLEAVDCGADGFLCKPFQVFELVAQVRALLRIKEYGDRLRGEKDHLGCQLSETEDRYGRLFESANDAIMLFEDMRIVDVNRRCEELFRVTREDLLGKSPVELSPPRQRGGQDSAQAARSILERARGGDPQCFTWTHQRFDGSQFDVEVSLDLVLFGQREHVLAIVRDISERVKMEGSLRESEAKYRQLFESAYDAIVLLKNGLIVDANSKAETLFRVARKKVIGTSYEAFFPPTQLNECDSVAEADRRLEQAVTGQAECFEFQFTRADGSALDAEVSLTRIDVDDEVFILAVIRDVSEKRRIEETTRIQSAAFRAAANAIVITDAAGTVLSVNPAFTELTGYAAGEVVGQNPRVLKSGQQDAAFYERMWRTIVAGNTWHDEVVNRKKDGTLYTEDMTITPVRTTGDSVTHFIAIKQDISERKAAEERYKQMQAQFLQAQKMDALGRLAGGVAHDFNNLLTSIIGFSEIVLDALPADTASHADVEAVLQAGKSATELTRQLLTFSRKQTAQLEHFDLNELIAGLEKLLHRTLGEHIELKTELTAASCLIRADKGQIEQVIMNLCVNARDAMPLGGRIHLATSVVDGAGVQRAPESGNVRPEQYVEMTVRDHGCGMPDAVREHAFEPFYTTKGSAGTGLGLSTVYGIVKQLDGEIAIESAVDAGTRFAVYIPCRQLAVLEPAARPNDQVTGGTETLLVVEDRDDVRKLVVRMLGSLGYRLIEASSAKQALSMFSRDGDRIHAVVTDVMMPDQSGPSLVEELRKMRADIKALFMTGHPLDAHWDDQHEPATVLYKPFTLQKLGQHVRELLDRDAA